MGREIDRASRILADVPVELYELIQSILWRAGFNEIKYVDAKREALSVFDSYEPDLLLLDCTMRDVDGLSLLRQLRAHVAEQDYLPILAITSERTKRAHEAALSLGARDLISKPFDATEFVLRVENLLEARQLHRRMGRIVEERTRDLERALTELLRCLATAADYRDDATGKHGVRVGEISGAIAKAMGVPGEEVRRITLAATLHDVGKIGVPDHILQKTGALDPAEFEIMKDHTTVGAKILGECKFEVLMLAREIALYHHEHWDGGGYFGLRGQDIPFAARIVAVADAFDVMLSTRPYKLANTPHSAFDEIKRMRGRQFDPEVADALISCSDTGLLQLDQAVSGHTGALARSALADN